MKAASVSFGGGGTGLNGCCWGELSWLGGGDCVCNLSVSEAETAVDSWELVSTTDSSISEVVPGGSSLLEPVGSESRIAVGAMATMMMKKGCC